MVSECLSLADAAQDTVRKHPAPTPLNTRRQEGRSGKREPCTLERGGVEEGTKKCCRNPDLWVSVARALAATETRMGTART